MQHAVTVTRTPVRGDERTKALKEHQVSDTSSENRESATGDEGHRRSEKKMRFLLQFVARCAVHELLIWLLPDWGA